MGATTNNGGGSNVPFRAGDWKCVSCTYHNFAKNVVCLRCGGPKTVGGAGVANQANLDVLLLDGSCQNGSASTISLSEMHNGGSGFGVSLETRSSSEPAW